ncbi:hypothetical protein LIP62_04305 [Longicatena caecimuris]|uniref:hypothetical protein n=1 Tax=Longicatena caecimuris TaxID=1796635 RepID=UPI001D01B36C|nr:hypothetical protein [Longicatena caecimuris]MCB5393423.1 hypothetical protein [Longicatena caecimuris]MCB5564378.1 hypothetical protein [Longicatena caecimuris]
MKYDNLNQMVRESSSTRRYFLSLPVPMQIKLHDQSEYIHSAAELHRRVDEIKKYDKQVQLSEFYHF